MELVKSLTTQFGVTGEQAAGGAGAIFRVVEARMTPGEFMQVADVTPAISDLMGKAPEFNPRKRGGLVAWLSKLVGGLGTLRLLVPVFREMGLDETHVRRFASAIVDFVDHQGAPEVKRAVEDRLR